MEGHLSKVARQLPKPAVSDFLGVLVGEVEFAFGVEVLADDVVICVLAVWLLVPRGDGDDVRHEVDIVVECNGAVWIDGFA